MVSNFARMARIIRVKKNRIYIFPRSSILCVIVPRYRTFC